MKKIIRREVWYRCSTCKSEYKSKKEARDCETRTLEIQPLAIGDKVANREQRMCAATRNRPYRFKGRVVAITGPRASDYENEVKWLGAIPDRVHGHVFEYDVEFMCPLCRQKKTRRYYSPELRKLKH